MTTLDHCRTRLMSCSGRVIALGLDSKAMANGANAEQLAD